MKKILVSLSIIGAVAAVVVGATTAFFSDVETSTGNTLTAGTLDLSVNGENPLEGPIVTLEDLKPSIPQYVETSFRVNDNPAKVFLHIDWEECDEGTETEPEEEEEGEDQYCWLDEVTAYDLEVNGQTIIPIEADLKLFWDIMSCWIPLGEFGPEDGDIPVIQSFHLQDEVTNWAQGDIEWITEEFLALQPNAPDPSPTLEECINGFGPGSAGAEGVGR